LVAKIGLADPELDLAALVGDMSEGQLANYAPRADDPAGQGHALVALDRAIEIGQGLGDRVRAVGARRVGVDTSGAQPLQLGQALLLEFVEFHNNVKRKT